MRSMLMRGRSSHVWKSFFPSPVMVVSSNPEMSSVYPQQLTIQ
jgi:hypothetical protein